MKLVLDNFTRVEFICTHLSAHAHNVSIRNAEFERTHSDLLNGIDAGADACVIFHDSSTLCKYAVILIAAPLIKTCGCMLQYPHDARRTVYLLAQTNCSHLLRLYLAAAT